MTNGEVQSLCLNDRKVKLEEMKNELEQLDIDYHKANFEQNSMHKQKTEKIFAKRERMFYNKRKGGIEVWIEC